VRLNGECNGLDEQKVGKSDRANQQTFENLIDLQDAINAAAIK